VRADSLAGIGGCRETSNRVASIGNIIRTCESEPAR
jgi:hypothetical protein